MKRFHFFLLIGAAAALAACQKQNVINEPAEQDGSYVFTLKATADVITKTDFDAEGTFSWTAGDAISVLFNNGTTNKFFTLTTEGSGASADFSGTIDAGYTIGASDGTTDDLKIWALYPASENHSYSVGGRPSFYIPETTDFTAEGAAFSANLPMYELLASEGELHFKHLCGAFKFTIKDIDASISKIKVVFQNQKSYYLSGNISMSSGPYLSFGSGGSKSRTFICNVSADHTAVIYVPIRYGQESFMPIVTIYNAENDAKITELTAKSASVIDAKGKVQRITISASGSGTPWEFESAYGINWNSVTASVDGDSGTDYDGIKTMKATADADNLYVYLEVKKDALYDDAGYQYSNQSQLYIGDGSGETAFWAWPTPYTHRFESWMKYKNAPRYINWNAGFVGQKAMEHGDCYYYEIAIARSSYSALSGSSCTLCFYINKKYVYKDEAGAEVWAGEDTQIGFAPARWTEGLTVTLP